MNLNARNAWLILWLAAAAPALAADQIPWAADFQTACGMAAEQHRLVLLHFYNDNCGPCVRVEQNVFSRPQVAETVAQNYLAVKVHAGKTPQLANRYRVQQWPTDVVVTPSGLEVFRTVSPQQPDDYIAMLNQVAQQTGVGSARQWKSQMAQTLGNAAHDTQTAAKAAAGAAQQRAEQSLQQATNSIQQSAAAARNWSQQATDAVQNYEKQAGDSYRQFREQTGGLAQQVHQQADATRNQWQATTQKATDDVAHAAQGLKDQMHQVSQSLLDRRSAFVSGDASPAAQPAAQQAAMGTQPPAADSAPAVAPPASNSAQLPAQAQAAPTTAATALVEKQPPAVTTNPWVAGNQTAAAAPPFIAAQPQPQQPAQSHPLPQAAGTANHQMVPVSQAPPIALDGFCPVTLREVIAVNAADRGAWKKGDRRFGAIHNGRTYLFASADQQQKFLANPDAYAPVLSGCDPVLFAERGQMVDGRRAFGLVTADRQVYLFADEATLNRFKQAPGNYAGAIQQAKARSDAGNLYR